MGRFFTHSLVGTMLIASLMLTLPLEANPFTMSYSGRLATDTGEGVVGPVKLEVRFFKVASGGTAIGVSPIVKNSVTLNDGVFQIDLTELSFPEYHLVLDALTSTWIEIRDATNAKTYPRQKMTAVPFAMKVPVDGVTVKYDSNGKLMAESAVPVGGTNGQFLQTNGSGTLSWGTPSGSGDMNTAVFDTNADSIVDIAAGISGQGSLATANSVSGGASGTITDSTITDADISASAAIATSKLSGAVTAIPGNGLGALATLAAVNSATITDNSVTNLDINASAAIATSKLSGPVTSIASNGLGALATAGAVSGGVGGTITDSSIDDNDIASISGGKINGGIIAGATNMNTTGYIKSDLYFGALNGAPVKFYNPGSANFVSLQAPAALGANVIFTLPNGYGANGDVLTSDGAGVLYFAPPGAGSNIVANSISVISSSASSPGVEVGIAGTGLFGDGVGMVAVATGSTERMRVDSAGNVGIGISTPTEKLHVNGNVLVSGQVIGNVNSTASSTIDFNLGNVVYHTGTSGTLTLSNMLEHTSYKLILDGGNGGYSFAGLTCMPGCPQKNGPPLVLDLVRVATIVYVGGLPSGPRTVGATGDTTTFCSLSTNLGVSGASGAGTNCNMAFAPGFGANPVCTCSVQGSGSCSVDTVLSGSVDITTYNVGGTATGMPFHLICIGM